MTTTVTPPVPTTGRTAVWRDGTTLDLVEMPVPVPGPGQALIRVRACGICGSDLHRFHTGTSRQPPPGIGPGHEVAGEIIALGPDTAGPPSGTRVAPFPGFTCGVCAQCRRGRPPLCPSLRIMGGAVPGGMAEYALVPASLSFPLPDDLPWPVAALTEPCAVSLHGLKRAGLMRGQRVLVLGAGAIGLFAVLVARDAGADAIGVTARYPHQREAALVLGATDVYDSDELRPGSMAARRGWDVVVETVGGQAPTFQQAIDVAAPGGTVVLLGVHQGAQPLNTTALWLRELTVVGSFGHDVSGSRADFEEAIALLDRYRERVTPLITHTYPLDRVNDAFATAVDKRSGAIKVIVTP